MFGLWCNAKEYEALRQYRLRKWAMELAIRVQTNAFGVSADKDIVATAQAIYDWASKT